MARQRLRPGISDSWRAEQILLFFDFAHHKIARFEPPIDVPFGGLIARVQEHGAFSVAPADRKLVLFGEMANAAEIEYHDGLQRMLSDGAQRAVIDELHQAEKSEHCRDEQD